MIEAECKKCSNRDPFFSGIEGLYYCLLKCPKDKPIRDEAGYCQYSCDKNGNFKTVKKECARCPNRIFQEIKTLGDGIGECFLKPKDTCPPEKPIKFENLCLSCEQEEGSYIENCFKICPGYNLLNRKCVRSVCPPEGPIRSREGKCLPCTGIDKYNRWEQGEEHDVIPVWSKDEDGKCPERSLAIHDNKYFLYKKDILKEGTFLSLDYASQKL